MVASRSPQSIQSILAKYQLDDKGGHISREFQDFGYQLAVKLDDMPHKSLYMRLAKTVQRGILERALSFVSDANAQSKAKLFMWKVKQLRGPITKPGKEKPGKEKVADAT